jgi:hypothetical protein
MLGYSDALAPSSLADGRTPQRVVVGVTGSVVSGFTKILLSGELPFVPVPLRLTVMAIPNGDPGSEYRIVVTPIAVQRPDAVRGANILPDDARRLLYPSSWYLTSPEEALDVPLNLPLSFGLPNDPLDRYMGLGAVVANPSDADIRVSLIWEVLYTDAE